MFLYSIQLTLIVLAAAVIYTLIRLLLYRPLHLASEELIQNRAKEQSNFLETVRGMQTIKLFSREAQRRGIWQNRYAEVINSEISLSRLRISFE